MPISNQPHIQAYRLLQRVETIILPGLLIINIGKQSREIPIQYFSEISLGDIVAWPFVESQADSVGSCPQLLMNSNLNPLQNNL